MQGHKFQLTRTREPLWAQCPEKVWKYRLPTAFEPFHGFFVVRTDTRVERLADRALSLGMNAPTELINDVGAGDPFHEMSVIVAIEPCNHLGAAGAVVPYPFKAASVDPHLLEVQGKRSLTLANDWPDPFAQ